MDLDIIRSHTEETVQRMTRYRVDQKNNMEMEKTSSIIAFDYGTSMSTVAIIKNNEIIFPLDSEHAGLITSVVLVTKDSIRCVPNLSPKIKVKGVLLQNTKRLLGKHKRDFKDDMLAGGEYGADVQFDENERLYFNCPVGDKKNPEYRKVYPEEVFSVLLDHVVKVCKDRLEETPITLFCLTIPHYTTERARFLMRREVRKLGLECSFIIKEPTAAGIPYLLPSSSSSAVVVQEEENVLVFDFGGGTLDITIIRRQEDSYIVVGSGGDPTLGGAVIDSAISKHVIEHYQSLGIQLLGKPGKPKPKKEMELRTKCREAKEGFSEGEVYEFNSGDFVNEGENIVYNLTLRTFNTIMMPIVELCKKAYQKVLNTSKLDNKDIDHVLLVGGSSKIQCIRDIFKDKHIMGDKEYNPQKAVARGAIVAAKHDLVNNKLQEIMESTIGIMIYNQNKREFEPHIEKGITIPTSTHYTYTLAPNEDSSDIIVYRDIGDIYHQEGYISLNNLLRRDGENIEITVYIDVTVDGALKYRVVDDNGRELGKEDIFLT